MGTVHQINVNPDGGVPKFAVPSALLGISGVEGDLQRNLDYHGGPNRAACLFCLEVIEQLQREGHPIVPGSVGENLTISGLDWSLLAPGRRLRIGAAILEIASFTKPCKKIRASFSDGNSMRIWQDQYPGQSRLYARVLTSAAVRVNDPVELLPQ
jgi:MOSC domain-containing protein YiiM